MSRQANRYGNRRVMKEANLSNKQPKPKFVEERQQRAAAPLVAKNQNQKKYLQMLNQNILVIASGYAGTGKTYIACHWAARELLAGRTKKIILARPYVATGKSIGALTGDKDQKMMPFMLPMIGYLREVFGNDVVEQYMDNGIIEIVPFEMIRGRSFENCVVICDEMQNADVSVTQAITTRIGDDCTMILCGDWRQNDLKREQNGISYLMEIIDKYDISGASYVEFGADDICRSGIVREFVLAYEDSGWK